MIFAFIAAFALVWPVRMLCRVLGVSPSGYYARRARGPSDQDLSNLELCFELARLFHRYKQRYGAPRLWQYLRQQGLRCSRNRVTRQLKRLGLCGLRIRKQSHNRPQLEDAANLLNRDFEPGGKLAVCADITEIKTQTGKSYLAAVMCLHTRRILGWSCGASASAALACAALSKAVQKQNLDGWLHHSDRGSAYKSEDYQELLSKFGLTRSFSKPGDCYDNAAMESFFGTMKREMELVKKRPRAQSLRGMLAAYIDGFYNTERLHSKLGYRSPETYAKMILVT